MPQTNNKVCYTNRICHVLPLVYTLFINTTLFLVLNIYEDQISDRELHTFVKLNKEGPK